ncbi:TetR/AcrR family transcriptional regulator [Pseudonocardia adelaidensis]|uniref:HTH tetR-type domain-containing protein n=1 Tax=Pseudonocardia adelaidensis TaxID=648754 RepID=A0ABP9NV55_9PSEU
MAELSTRPTKDVLTDVLLDITAQHGLEAVSVRQVAAAAGVSIGTVQHHFPTKDAMLGAAFTEVVRRIRERVANVVLGPDVQRNLTTVLRELLPLDERRATEVRIQVAFAARAATAPALAAVQADILAEVTESIARVIALAGHGTDGPETSRRKAHIALAAVDGLALHAVSSGSWLDPATLTDALDHLIGMLLVP